MQSASGKVGNIISKSLYANDALKNIVTDDIEGGRFVHALIIEGPPKSGKLTLARALLAELSGDASAADKIMRGICADVYEISQRAGRKTIGVEAVREIRESAFVVANDSDIKGYIIRYADTMTVQAQNAILKLLEEPPKNVYFMLLVENAATLLATVRSRAPVIRMQVFTREELHAYLTENSMRAREMASKAPDEFSRIIARSGGSIGEAMRIINEGTDSSQSLGKQVVELLEILVNKDRAGLAVFPFPSKTREELSAFLLMLRIALRDMCALRAGGKCEALFGDDEKLSSLSKKVGITTLLKAENEVTQIVQRLERNLGLSNIRSQLTVALWNAFSN